MAEHPEIDVLDALSKPQCPFCLLERGPEDRFCTHCRRPFRCTKCAMPFPVRNYDLRACGHCGILLSKMKKPRRFQWQVHISIKVPNLKFSFAEGILGIFSGVFFLVLGALYLAFMIGLPYAIGAYGTAKTLAIVFTVITSVISMIPTAWLSGWLVATLDNSSDGYSQAAASIIMGLTVSPIVSFLALWCGYHLS